MMKNTKSCNHIAHSEISKIAKVFAVIFISLNKRPKTLYTPLITMANTKKLKKAHQLNCVLSQKIITTIKLFVWNTRA